MLERQIGQVQQVVALLRLVYNMVKQLLPAQRCASAALAMVLCPSVRPSVTSRYCIEMAERIEFVLA